MRMQGCAYPLWMRPLKPPEGARKPPGCPGSASVMKSDATLCVAHHMSAHLLSKAEAEVSAALADTAALAMVEGVTQLEV